MSSKIWIINLLLASFALFFGIKAYDVWDKKEEKIHLETESPSNYRNYSDKRFMKKAIFPESAYNIVAEKNLFSSDRIELIPEETPEPEPEVTKPLNVSGQKITLYGVIIMDDYKSALINNPNREPDERENKWVKEGDTLGDVRVAAIQKERIFLTQGDKKYEIPLYDEKKKSFVRNQNNSPTVQPTVVVSEPEKKAPPPAVSKGNTQPVDDEYEIVNTPFGKIKRKKKK